MLTYNSDLKTVLKLCHPCRCNKCENLCKYGSGALVEDELNKIAEFLRISVDELRNDYLEEITKLGTTLLRPRLIRSEYPYGKCIFYDNGCKIHEVKPMECKIAMGCKPYGPELNTWFNLTYFLDPEKLESLRQFKIYLESGGQNLPGTEGIFTKEKLDRMFEYDDLKTKEIKEVENERKTKDVS